MTARPDRDRAHDAACRRAVGAPCLRRRPRCADVLGAYCDLREPFAEEAA